MDARVERVGDATLYLGDSLEILPTLRGLDAVVTDPPYGIGFSYASHDDSEARWYELMDRFVPLARAAAPVVVMPTCALNSKRMAWWYAHHPPTWLVAWYKGSPGHQAAIGFNDWEPHLIWGKPPGPIHDFFQTPLKIPENGH